MPKDRNEMCIYVKVNQASTTRQQGVYSVMEKVQY